MPEKSLEQLLESKPKAFALKLFLMNPEGEFTLEDAVQHTLLKKRQFTKELKKFMKIGLVVTKIVREAIAVPARRSKKRAQKPKMRIVRKRVFFVNKDFPMYPELRDLVWKIAPDGYGALLAKVKNLGNMKLAIISGVFLKYDGARADLMLVGDRLKRARIASFLKKVRRDLGRDINYSVMTTPEFCYRFEMQDRFIRDVLDFPHEKLINKLNV